MAQDILMLKRYLLFIWNSNLTKDPAFYLATLFTHKCGQENSFIYQLAKNVLINTKIPKSVEQHVHIKIHGHC